MTSVYGFFSHSRYCQVLVGKKNNDNSLCYFGDLWNIYDQRLMKKQATPGPGLFTWQPIAFGMISGPFFAFDVKIQFWLCNPRVLEWYEHYGHGKNISATWIIGCDVNKEMTYVRMGKNAKAGSQYFQISIWFEFLRHNLKFEEMRLAKVGKTPFIS